MKHLYKMLVILFFILCFPMDQKVEAASTKTDAYVGTYGYESLSKNQKKVYQRIVALANSFHSGTKNADELTEGETYVTDVINLSSYKIKKAELDQIMFAIEADHPMLYWYDGTAYTYTDNIIVKFALRVNPKYYKASIRKKMNQKISNKIKTYTAKIDKLKKQGADTIDLELYIHDQIIMNMEQLEVSEATETQKTDAHTIVGAFTTGNVVCEGYAKAFQLLANYAGIKSVYAIGYANGVSHAWNIVRIDGKWYNVDVTWDDLGEEDADSLGISYLYFNCLDDLFLVSHEYTDTYAQMYQVPTVTSNDEYTFYDYYKLAIEEEDLTTKTDFKDTIIQAIRCAEEREEYELRFLIAEDQVALFKKQYKQLSASIEQSLKKNGVLYELGDLKESEQAITCDEEVYYVYNAVYEKQELTIKSTKTFIGTPNYTVTSHKGRTNKDMTSETSYNYSDHIIKVYSDGKVLGQYELDTAKITVSKVENKVYANKAYTPKPNIYAEGTKLTLGKDYTLTYKNNKNAGTATILIKGKGNYAGIKQVTFQIKKKNISSVSISKIADQTYTGKNITPKVTLSYGGSKLVNGTDYKLTYSNNKKTGKANVVIKGTGKNYSGTNRLSFYIVPKKVHGVKVTRKGKKTTISFAKVTGATGYTIYYSTKKNSSYKVLKTTTKNRVSTGKLSARRTYYIKIRAYKLVGKRKQYGQYNSIIRILKQ